MNKHRTPSPLLVAVCGILGAGPIANAQPRDTSGYLVDQRNVVVRSGTNLCWRTGYWTPAMAIFECDPDLVPRTEAPAAVAPPPPPAPPTPSAPPPRPAAQKVSLAADTLFDFDKAELRPEGKSRLDQLIGATKDVTLEVIIVVGHTDRIGTERYNQRLSERRADSVKAHLIGMGVDPNRIHAEGRGETQPVTGADCARMGRESGSNRKLVECLQPDRRVVIEVIGTR